MTESVEFDTTVAATGNNTGIVVPVELIERLGAGRRPAVVVNLNGYEYRNTVGIMGGKHMISISAAVRKETGPKGDLRKTYARGHTSSGRHSRRPLPCPVR